MLYVILQTLISVLRSRGGLVAENLALRHQLNVLQRTAKKPRLHRSDRLLWVLLLRLWKGWRESLTIVQPETVIRWHREDSVSTGDGRADRADTGGRRSPRRSGT